MGGNGGIGLADYRSESDAIAVAGPAYSLRLELYRIGEGLCRLGMIGGTVLNFPASIFSAHL